MNATGRGWRALIFLSLCLFCLVASEGVGQSLSALGTAWAAEGENGAEDEPFTEKAEAVSDPLQGFNRAMFKFNDKLYFWVLKPVGIVYAAYLPPGVRIAIRNAYTNIFFPVRFVNNGLQGKFERCGTELGRFLVNSTMGVGGLFDIAGRDFNLTEKDEDFGQTLGHYGLKSGVYVVWPFFGPSSVRDSVGMAGDALLDPFFYIPTDFWVGTGINAGKVVNNTSLRIGEYEDFKKSALDPYVSMRDAYLQHRAEDVRK